VKRTLPFLAVIILVVLAMRLPLLNIPLDRDEGGYAYIAWRMGFGELPYRDWIDQKPPGVFWIYHMALSLPMDATQAVHCMAMLFSVASACALFWLALRFTSPLWAMAAAVLFGIFSADPLVEGTSANTELFMLLPLILSLIALLAAVRKSRGVIALALLAGALTGAAIAFKQVAVVNWPLLVIGYWLLIEGTRRVGRTVAFAAWSAIGTAAVWGLIGFYFLLHRELHGLVYHVFTHNLGYVETLSWKDRLESCLLALHGIYPSEAALWIFSAAGFFALWKGGRHRIYLFLGAWTAASLAGVCMSGYFFRHYFEQLLPVLCLAAVLGAEAIAQAGFWKATPLATRQAVLCIALLALPLTVAAPFLFVYSPREAVREIYPGNSLFAEMPELGKRIAALTHPDDRVFMFGADPEALFYARRISATRYIFLLPLYGSYRDADAVQKETAAEVAAHAPTAAVYLPNQMFFDPGDDQYFTQWSKAYLKSQFHPDTYFAVDQYNIGHLIPGSSPDLPKISAAGEICGVLFVRTVK
jgi:4-amino-4-deoxy-L-arabinose transferase-like glycosyltransferase